MAVWGRDWATAALACRRARCASVDGMLQAVQPHWIGGEGTRGFAFAFCNSLREADNCCHAGWEETS